MATVQIGDEDEVQSTFSVEPGHNADLVMVSWYEPAAERLIRWEVSRVEVCRMVVALAGGLGGDF